MYEIDSRAALAIWPSLLSFIVIGVGKTIPPVAIPILLILISDSAKNILVPSEPGSIELAISSNFDGGWRKSFDIQLYECPVSPAVSSLTQ